jgi:hypothetical protein
MAVLLAVATAGDVNPVILTVGGFEDELVEVNMALEPVEPLVSGSEVGMTLVVVPGGVGGEGQTDVDSFA